MLYINEIPYLKVYKLGVWMPDASDDSNKDNLIILNNNDTKDISLLIGNKLINPRRYYRNYYIDAKYFEKIVNKQVRLDYKDSRKVLYKQISTKYGLQTPMRFDVINHKNLYYDISVYNQIFFKYIKVPSMKRKIEEYINYFNKIMSNQIVSSYNNKFIFINIDSWMKFNKIDNPIIYIFTAYKKYFDTFKKLGDKEIFLYTTDSIFRFNPSKCEEKDFPIFKQRLNTILKHINLDDEETFEKELTKSELKDKIVTTIAPEYNFTGTKSDEKNKKSDENDVIAITPDTLKEVPKEEKIASKIAEKNIDKTEVLKNEKEELKKELDIDDDEIEVDNELLSDIYNIQQVKSTGKTTASLKRDEELKKKQQKIKLEGKTLGDIKKMDNSKPLPVTDISSKVTTTNPNATKIRFNKFEKEYNDKLMKQDFVNSITALNDKSIPVYVLDIDIKDSSDELNYMDTYTIKLEDANRVRHTVVVDIPKFVDDKFLYIDGNRKIINKQLFMKPICKTGPDEVQICTNYNKIFIYRIGAKLTPKAERFKKALSATNPKVKVLMGDASEINFNYNTTLEYDDISQSINSIKSNGNEIIFNQKDIHDRLGSTKIPDDKICIGFLKGEKPILLDKKTEKIGELDMIDYIVSIMDPSFQKTYEETDVTTKKFMYSRATVMGKKVPIVLLVGYCEGLSTVLKKGNVRHYFSDTRPKVSDNETYVEFADGYLVFDRYPIENSLLLNALLYLPTKSYNYADFDDKNTYVELFDILYSARNLANAFDTFYDFMIDPITKEVLEELDYPTDFVSVVLCANVLLGDNKYIRENNMNLYRIRSNEVVNALFYKELANAYGKYKATAYNKNPIKISMPRNAVIKELMALQTVESISTLNPIYELEKTRAITYKGYNGLNVSEAYTLDKRTYDKTMAGILAINTSPDGNVGVSRFLTMEPNVKNARGFIDINDDKINELSDVNLFSPSELLTTMGITHDDSSRTAMAAKQSKHTVPVAKSSPVLISNGAEQVIQQYLSDDFIVRAEKDGKIVEINEDVGIAVIAYNDGTHKAIDIKPRIVKNSDSGFYLSNQLQCDLKVGDKVKANDIVAYENKFFSNETLHGNRFNIGSMQKIAIMSSYITYEDSTYVTKKMSEEMASDIIMMKDVVIGKNANISNMVNIGDVVKVDDVLIEYETSFDNDVYNKFLADIGDDLAIDEIKSLGKYPIKTKYAGVIEDIKIYTSVELDELSPSLRRLVTQYYGKINKKKNLLNKYDKTDSIVKAGMMITESTKKLEPGTNGKIKGRELFDGVLIEFYIKYRDVLTVGDKITFFSALKSIIGEVVPEGYEPYSEYRPNEEVSAFLSPNAVLARMTPSIIYTMFANKVLIELKRHLEEIYNE